MHRMNTMCPIDINGLRHAAVLTLAIGLAQPAFAQQSTTPDSKSDGATMSANASQTVVSGEGASLEATFEYAASARALHVRYRLHNESKAPLMVFDRGNRHAVMTKQLVQGEIAAPLFAVEGDDVTLSHLALPLPQPAPTVPPTPLAARVEPSASLAGEFEFALPVENAPKRLRWCLGVAPFSSTDFQAIEGESVWTASFAVAESQQVLCTSWFDVTSASFEK